MAQARGRVSRTDAYDALVELAAADEAQRVLRALPVVGRVRVRVRGER